MWRTFGISVIVLPMESLPKAVRILPRPAPCKEEGRVWLMLTTDAWAGRGLAEERAASSAAAPCKAREKGP